MAGAEKVCEFSGEYLGWKMYDYKHNQLQIMPEYRRLFRGDCGILYVQFDEYKLVNKHFSMSYSARSLEIIKGYYPPFHKVKSYEFAYVTNEPKLFGNVCGIYTNYTSDLSATKRKLKRITRCKELDIRYVNDLNKTLEGTYIDRF